MRQFNFCKMIFLLAPFLLLMSNCKKAPESSAQNAKASPIVKVASENYEIKNDNLITVKVIFDKVSSPQIGSTIASLKYNKKKTLSINFDDAALSALRAKKYFDSKFYTDGCGNKINFTAGLAIVTSSSYDKYIANTSLINHPQRNELFYPEFGQFIESGWDIEHHSHSHSNKNIDGSEFSEKDYLKDVQTGLERTLKYSHYKMNTAVVPVNFMSYHKAFKENGLLSSTSQGFDDNNQSIPKLWDGWNKGKRISEITDYDYFAIQREFAVDGWPVDGGNDPGCIWNCAKQFLSKSGVFHQIGTHSWQGEWGINESQEKNFMAFIDYIYKNGGDDIMLTSTREFVEYQHVKHHLRKSELTKGDTLIIKLDYSNIPNKNISWRDISLIISSPDNILKVECDNKNFKITYNANTKLVNVLNRQTVW